MRLERKRGQVTIFIIVGVLIVVLAILIYMFYPSLRSNLGIETQTPSSFIQSCIEEDIENSIQELSIHGGSLKPEFYVLYDNQEIEYLCYNKEYYKTCVMQQPMLKEHIESEIKQEIEPEVEECFNALRKDYESKGYTASLKQGETSIELLPKRVVATFNYSLTLTKQNTEKYEPFRVVLNNNLYEFVSIANSILNWEARYGDSETTLYMDYYRDLKVEKKKQTDGTTIYILTDRNTEDKFQFASRSVAWPPGYRSSEVI